MSPEQKQPGPLVAKIGAARGSRFELYQAVKFQTIDRAWAFPVIFFDASDLAVLYQKESPSGIRRGFVNLQTNFALVRRCFIPFFLLWKDLERMLWGWARQCPFQRVRIFIPWVVLCDACAPADCIEHNAKEEDEGCEGEERAP